MHDVCGLGSKFGGLDFRPFYNESYLTLIFGHFPVRTIFQFRPFSSEAREIRGVIFFERKAVHPGHNLLRVCDYLDFGQRGRVHPLLGKGGWHSLSAP